MSYLRIISWNVLNEYYLQDHRDTNWYIALYFKNPTERDTNVLFQIEEFMKTNQPHLICLQEVNENLLTSLRNIGQRHGYSMELIANLYKKDWPKEKTGYLTDAYGNNLTQNYNVTFIAKGLNYQPIGIGAGKYNVLLISFQNINLSVINVHFPSSTFNREEFLWMFRNLVAATSLMEKLIIVGDINTKDFVIKRAWVEENERQQSRLDYRNDYVATTKKPTRIGTENYKGLILESSDHALVRGVKFLYSVSSSFNIEKYVKGEDAYVMYASDHVAIEWNFLID